MYVTGSAETSAVEESIYSYTHLAVTYQDTLESEQVSLPESHQNHNRTAGAKPASVQMSQT